MAETTYNYTVSTDTANGAVAISELQKEINADTTVVIGVRRIDLSGDSLGVVMMDSLPTAQETALTAVVAAHTGVEDPAAGTDTVNAIVREHLESTAGHYNVMGFNFDVAASTEDHHEVSFPFAIRPNTLWITPITDGDTGYLRIGADNGTVVGNITADITAADTVINVSQSVVDNVDPGYYVMIHDGTNTDFQRVDAVDKVAKTITLKAGTANAYAAATPTYIGLVIQLGESLEFTGGTPILFAAHAHGGPLVPANTPIRLYYNNVHTSQVRVRAKLEYWY
jgi:hypothetical protein